MIPTVSKKEERNATSMQKTYPTLRWIWNNVSFFRSINERE